MEDKRDITKLNIFELTLLLIRYLFLEKTLKNKLRNQIVFVSYISTIIIAFKIIMILLINPFELTLFMNNGLITISIILQFIFLLWLGLELGKATKLFEDDINVVNTKKGKNNDSFFEKLFVYSFGSLSLISYILSSISVIYYNFYDFGFLSLSLISIGIFLYRMGKILINTLKPYLS